jgi:DNA repair exonuclease SbcCD ATPase subunit
MIKIKNITLRNFLSIGAITQAVNFDRQDLTLILGDNLDLGGDGARNGTGKTSLIQGLSYALFGVPINGIRKDNLINRTNAKGMLVTLEFSIDSVEYKIERGRRPNILKFYVNSNLLKTPDDAQGENKETQAAIEKIINMSADMFQHIVALNTYTKPFLAMAAGDQRDIIEQLLGITILSEKAEIVKGLLTTSKDAIKTEEFRVKAIEDANVRIAEQIENLKRRQRLWAAKQETDLQALVTKYDDLSKIDIVAELQAHRDLVIYNQHKSVFDTYTALVARQTAWSEKRDRDVAVLRADAVKMHRVDIDAELIKHREVAEYNQRVRDKAAQDIELKRGRADIVRYTNDRVKIEGELASLQEHKCYACGQDLHDEKHTDVVKAKEASLAFAVNHLTQAQALVSGIEAELVVLGKMPSTHYRTEAEAIRHSSESDSLLAKIELKVNEVDPYAEHIAELLPEVVPVGLPPKTVYDTEVEAVEHNTRVDSLISQIESKHQESDPYAEQIVDMETKAIQVVSFDAMNAMNKTMEHQKFLLDLLTSKDSFVRKKIIDQNLSYLNQRMTHYLDKIGLPHQVLFQNDLNVQITELGRDLDFHNLSRGEMNRVILALSWAFRDVWENLYKPINVMFIDELLDNGTDSVGVENSIGVLKDLSRNRHKSIWLISHKDDLASRVSSVLRVVKSNGFTSYSTDADTENE